MFNYIVFRLNFYKDTKQILKTLKLLNMLEIREAITEQLCVFFKRMYDILSLFSNESSEFDEEIVFVSFDAFCL